jgi:hypothetical protein
MTNSELLLQLDSVYLAFNTAIVDKLLAYHAQGKTEAIRAILEDIDQK